MTRQEFYDKYKDVGFTFYGYHKYVFTFIGEYDGQTVSVGVGGNSDAIYRMEVNADVDETIASLQPFEGMCGDDSFYDY